MKAIVYKINRIDNQSYIGISVNFKKRLQAHLKSERFSIGIRDYEILKECDNYEEAEELEEHYIQLYDTFYHGLNNSINGKGNHICETFTTKGYTYSLESRKKMRESAIRRGCNNKGFKHSLEQRSKWSIMRSGKPASYKKISDEDAEAIAKSYSNLSLIFEEDFIRRFVKVSQKELVGKISIEKLKTPNGKYLSNLILYCHYYAEKFNVTPTAIKGIIKTNGFRCK